MIKDERQVKLATSQGMVVPMNPGQTASPQVRIAIKNVATSNIFYFAVNFNLEALLSPNVTMDRTTLTSTTPIDVPPTKFLLI